jgi:hypothetical protein
MREYTVKGMAMHRGTKVPFVVLTRPDDSTSLPVPIGPLEASSILIELEGATPPRPSAHDLLAHFFIRHHFRVTKIVISHVDEEFSSAVIHYRKGPKSYTIEALPADAIALALRLGTAIYLTDEAAAHARDKAMAEAILESGSPSYIYVEPESRSASHYAKRA